VNLLVFSQNAWYLINCFGDEIHEFNRFGYISLVLAAKLPDLHVQTGQVDHSTISTISGLHPIARTFEGDPALACVLRLVNSPIASH
jgi:hypothetical protein